MSNIQSTDRYRRVHRPPATAHRKTVCFFAVPLTTDVCTLPLHDALPISAPAGAVARAGAVAPAAGRVGRPTLLRGRDPQDRKSTRLNSSHLGISYAVFCLKKKNTQRPSI